MVNKYYQKKKKKKIVEKKHVKDIKIFPKKKKTRDEKRSEKDTRIFLKNKSILKQSGLFHGLVLEIWGFSKKFFMSLKILLL